MSLEQAEARPSTLEKPIGLPLPEKKRMDLEVYQISGLVDLFRENPWLTSREQRLLGKLSQTLKHAPADSLVIPIERSKTGILSCIEMLHFTPENDSPQQQEYYGRKNDTLTSIEQKIAKYTDISLHDENIFSEPQSVPLELQYALGVGGQPLLSQLKSLLESGDKLAMMQITTLHPQAYEALHTVLKRLNTSIDGTIRTILGEGTFAHDDQAIINAQETAKAEAQRLTHVKILTSNPNNPLAQKVEGDLNEILDRDIDTPYATWKFWESAVEEDVEIAITSIGGAVAVGAILSYFGHMLPDEAKKMIPPLIAEISTNVAAATPFIDKQLPPAEKIKQIIKILYKDYKIPIFVSAAAIPFSSHFAQLQENAGNNLLAGGIYTCASVVPTISTIGMSMYKYRKEQDATIGEAWQAIRTHPVQSTLLPSSLLSAGLSSGAILLGLGENATAITATTEGSEPASNIFLSLGKLHKKRDEYKETLKKDHRTTFLNFAEEQQRTGRNY